MSEEFLDSLNQQQPQPPANPAAVQEMENFTKQVTKYLGEPARCELLVGGVVNYGLEYSAVLTFPPMSYAQNLWRVYLPVDHSKIRFHVIGGQPEEIDDLHTALLDFLKIDAVKETMRYIKGKSDAFRTTGRV
jgi:hypothetical protein